MAEAAARAVRSPEVPAGMIARIVDLLHPEQLWLFGSRARGDARPYSDWDFMAVLPDGAREQDLEIASVWSRLRDLRVQRVELFTMTRSEFDEWKGSPARWQRSWHPRASSCMAADPSKPDPRVIAAYLDDVDLELDAAKRLIADPPNRFAAFHREQAAEKLVKAVRLGRGLRVTADHNIEALVDELATDDPWRAKLGALEPLAAYATAYRYPSPTGKRKGGPSNDEVLVWIKMISGLTTAARTELLATPS